LNLNPKADDFYTDRGGGAYLRKDHYDHAIKDYDEALKIILRTGKVIWRAARSRRARGIIAVP